jgi:hypothetical protein
MASYVKTRMVQGARMSELLPMNALRVVVSQRFPHGVAVLCAVALVLAACSNGTTRWHPSFVSQVQDSTRVRFVPAENERRISGLALDWDRGRPRVITGGGDTVVVPLGSTVEVRLREKAGHPVFGAAVGWALGVAVSYATCPAPKRYCGEEDPSPLLGVGLGALVGNKIKTDWWVGVRWDEVHEPPR